MVSYKSRHIDLAIFTNNPFFHDPIHVGRPNNGNIDLFINKINDIFDRNWLTNNGPYVQDFENRVCELLNVKNCIAICNATVALQILNKALELSGEVIVPSFTAAATVHSLEWQNIKPVFCDIDPDTHCIDPNKVEKLITDKTTGILGVHLWGQSCSIEKLSKIAQKHNLKLFFDAAHAFNCSYKTKMIGNFGLAEVLSFHATKFFHTFEGGAIVTNDNCIAEKIRKMKNFGFYSSDNVIHLGTNGKMSECSAAMGLTNLSSLDKFMIINKINYEIYQNQIDNIPGIKLLKYKREITSNHQYIVIEIDENITGLTRDELISVLQYENVLARKHFSPGCHRWEPYKSKQPDAYLQLPVTEDVCNKVMLLPTGLSINEDHIINICKIINIAVENSFDVKKILKR